MNNKTRYTDKQIEQLRILFNQGASDDRIAEVMGRGVEGIRYKRRQLGLHRPDAVAISKDKGHKWTDEEELFIRNYWSQMPDRWMAKKLGVTVSTYKHKRLRMTESVIYKTGRLVKKWTQHKGRHDSWTIKQEEFLREHYPTHAAKELARYLGKSTNAIQYKALRMGIRKAHIAGRRGYEPIEQYYNPETYKPQLIK